VKGASSGFGPSPVTAHAVTVAVDVENHAPMEQSVKHGAGDHGIVVEDLAPTGDPQIGGQRDASLQISLADNLEQRGRSLGGKREVTVAT
jgi:hypothetical protein